MPINPSGYYSGGAQGDRGRSARDIDAPQPPQSTISNAQQGGTASVGFGRGMMSMDQVAQNMERFGQQMQGVGRFQGFGGLIGRLIDSIG